MRRETTIRIFDEKDQEVFIGDIVTIQTKGNTYNQVKIKNFNPGNISIWINSREARTVAYQDIIKLDK